MNAHVTLAQIDSVLGDLAKNAERHAEIAEKAHAAGSQMVVFPELSLTGYSVKDLHWDLAIDPERPPGAVKPLLEASRSIPILAGAVEEGPDLGMYNAALLFHEGAVRTVHRKVYPPTYGMFEELRYFSPGRSVRAVDTPIGRIGVLVCEDLWHMSLAYLLALDGAEAIVTLVASPTRVSGTGEQLPIAVANAENQKAVARLLSVYVLFCNRVGFEDGVNFWGGSQVVGPDGNAVAQAKLFDEDQLTVQLETNALRRARRFSRHFLDEDATLVARELGRILGAKNSNGL